MSYARVIDRLADLSAWLFFLVGLMLSYEVVMRYFFNAPTIWAEELSRLAQVWATWLAAAWTLKNRRLIAVGILYDRLPPPLRRLAAGFTLLFIAAFSAVTLYYAVLITVESAQLGRKTATMLDMPLWVAEIAVPIGVGLLLVQSLVELVRLWRDPDAALRLASDVG
ncbi:MAG TPA: TRAP transporter small permease [Rhodospirillales bacterium]|nr:TRAP transporter small permease [Rhodospirillales bacterium]